MDNYLRQAKQCLSVKPLPFWEEYLKELTQGKPKGYVKVAETLLSIMRAIVSNREY